MSVCVCAVLYQILFVGEALVGNDGVHQLQTFTQSLLRLANSSTSTLSAMRSNSSATPRTIDGILLTKFDTVDTKVGAAISMTYQTGHPIVFVGTGQTYQDLKKMNAHSLVKLLLR